MEIPAMCGRTCSYQKIVWENLLVSENTPYYRHDTPPIRETISYTERHLKRDLMSYLSISPPQGSPQDFGTLGGNTWFFSWEVGNWVENFIAPKRTYSSIFGTKPHWLMHYVSLVKNTTWRQEIYKSPHKLHSHMFPHVHACSACTHINGRMKKSLLFKRYRFIYTTVLDFFTYRPISSYSGDCSEFGVVSTMKGPNHINHKVILHENCHSSSANRIFCLDPNYGTLMSMHCMLSELE